MVEHLDVWVGQQAGQNALYGEEAHAYRVMRVTEVTSGTWAISKEQACNLPRKAANSPYLGLIKESNARERRRGAGTGNYRTP